MFQPLKTWETHQHILNKRYLSPWVLGKDQYIQLKKKRGFYLLSSKILVTWKLLLLPNVECLENFCNRCNVWLDQSWFYIKSEKKLSCYLQNLRKLARLGTAADSAPRKKTEKKLWNWDGLLSLGWAQRATTCCWTTWAKFQNCVQKLSAFFHNFRTVSKI